MKSLTVLALLVSVTFAGCADSALTTPTSPSAAAGPDSATSRAFDPTIAAIAAANPAFSTLVAALVKANLVDTFNGRQHFTVFAPTNDAFDALAAAFGQPSGAALVDALDVATLTSVLTYHVTRGDRNATSVLAAGSLRMLDGNIAEVSTVGGPSIAGAPIVRTDIRASNGIVHVLGGVMVPPSLR
jgi:transforming growth factor-beta-induced protein